MTTIEKNVDEEKFHMEVELIDFFPPKKIIKGMWGYLHVYLIDYDLDIRGIEVRKINKGGVTVWMPLKEGQRFDTGQKVLYTTVQFANKLKNTALREAIKLKIPEFMKEWFSKNKECKRLAREMGYINKKHSKA
jgi:hypothetical protein